tara:strand:- start:4656 stop:6368 length:1713 start_codon:yes stop_codon:yes gene_type:complete
MQDAKTREINIAAPTRGGKTLTADLFYAWSIKNRPVPYLHVFQNDTIAKDHARNRIWPMLDGMEWYQDYQPLVHTHRQIQSGVHRHGMPFLFTGPAVNKLQSKGFATVVCDEPWLYKAGVLDEARGRLADYARQGQDKFICIAQAGNAVCDDWIRQFRSAPMFEWWAPCDACGDMMRLSWSGVGNSGEKCGITYEATKDAQTGTRNVEEARHSARFTCPHCGHNHRDTQAVRRRWNNKGGYYHIDDSGVVIPETDFTGRKISFRFNSLINTSFADLAGEWVEAQNHFLLLGDENPRIKFIQKRLAENPEEVDELNDAPRVTVTGTQIKDGLPSWDDAHRLAMSIDCQLDHYWIWVEAVNKTGTQTMVLYADRVGSLPEVKELQKDFGVEWSMVGKDISDKRTTRLRDIARMGEIVNGRLQCWFGMAGQEGAREAWTHYNPKLKQSVMRPYNIQRGDPSMGMHRSNPEFEFFKRRGVPFVEWSNTTFKTELHRRYQSSKEGKEMLFHPSINTQLVEQHFSAEYRVKERNRHVWKIRGRRPNHLWDCGAMSCALLSISGCLTIGQGVGDSEA